MNFLLHHEPILTYDIDFFVRDLPANLRPGSQEYRGEMGRTEAEWDVLPESWEWLLGQQVFCLTSPSGAIDIFRSVKGLEGRYEVCKKAALRKKTPGGVAFWSLSDRHMLAGSFGREGKKSGADENSAGSTFQGRRMMNRSEDKKREELKREKAWDPAERWRVIQEMITWTEANLPYEKRRNRPRLPKSQ